MLGKGTFGQVMLGRLKSNLDSCLAVKIIEKKILSYQAK
jgi:hypothetical protein